jgi:restriction endonuclease S subunit
VYSVDAKAADPRFIAWFLRSPVFLGRAPIASSPGQLPRIRTEEVAAVEVDLPRLADQHRIVELLSEQMMEVEGARAAAEARLEASQELETSFLREAFENHKAKTWPQRNLGEVCRLVGGSTPSSGLPEYWNGDIVWITPTDLGRLATPVIYESERHISQLGYESCGTELVPIGTVLISSRAPIGHVAIADVQLCTNQGCKSFIPGALIDSNYLYFALRSSVPRIRELGSGATVAEVSKATLGTFPIALPMLDEQLRIASELAKKIRLAENLNAAAGAELQGFRSVPAELLRRAFTGEL